MNPAPLEARVDSRVLEQALLLSGDEQARFVRETYKEDPAAASSMLRFLSRIGQMGSFLGEPALDLARPQTQLQAGDLLENRFKVLALAGRGGMGEVYRVHDELSGETLALKLCRDLDELSGQELELLREEILLARRITHPNVCRLHELFASDRSGRTTIFFTMEWLAGEPLAQTIAASAPLAPEAVISIAEQVAAGLEAIHRLHVVHRDLKPGNIFLVPQPDGSRRAVITDFGLAFDPHAPDTSALIMGTPDYMAPEQLMGEPVGPAADIYSLALILYEMLTGQRLYGNANLLQTIIRRVTESQPALAPSESLPASLIPPLTCALSKRPVDRYQSASAFLAALSSASAGKSGTKPSRRKIVAAISAASAISLSSWWGFLRFHHLENFTAARPAVMLTPITFSTAQTDLGSFVNTG